MWRDWAGTVSILACVANAGALHAAQPEAQDLKRLSIEDLMQIDVTIASRQAEPIGTTAAAVSVITGDDIRRAGVTTIADALLLADGLHVARFNNGTWAVTARGFNQNTANKLLVMIDGRTVYSPLFTGVFWNTVDYVLEDIDRIEIIRGPGAVLWGANAVNGVINIVTRSARDTRGGYFSVTSGNEDPLLVDARYGGALSSAAWRLYAKAADRDPQVLAGDGSAGDRRQRAQVGFRADGGNASAANWLVKADAFHSRDGLLRRADGEFTDLSLQGRWSVPAPKASRVAVQAYFRHEYRRIPQQLTHRINIFDLDAQHSGAWGGRHSVVWGGGVRSNWDRTYAGPLISFDPPARTHEVVNVFAQDEVALIPNRLDATLGAKWEHNAFTGGEFQPNVRARLSMPRSQVLWGAVSRAVRRPTRFEEDLNVSAPNGLLLIRGNDQFVPETLRATELGYRIQPSPMVSVDAALFHHHYEDLRSQDSPVGAPIPLTIGNSLMGRSRGLELGINLQPVTAWRTHVSYTWLDVSIERAPGSRDASGGLNEANDPEHMFFVRTSIDLPRGVQADALFRVVGALPHPVIDGYSELNLRVGWRASRHAEIFVTGQDLLHAQHAEFGTAGAGLEEFERAVRAGVAVRF